MKMGSNQINAGEKLSEEDLKRILGIDIIRKLKQYTEHIYSHVDEDLASLKKQYEVFRSVINKLYPKRKVIQIEFLPTEVKKSA